MRTFAIYALVIALPLSCAAQRGGGIRGSAPAGRPPAHHFSGGDSSALAGGPYSSRFSRYSPYGSLLFPFFDGGYDLDDLYASGYPVASQPPMIPLQAALALAGSRRGGMMGDAFDRGSAPAEPLMIELKDGQYVRVSSASGGSEVQTLSAQTLPVDSQPAKLAHGSSESGAAVPRDLPAAILVFRDGHSEEVRDYTIADGILYAHGDFYTNGYWNKPITLSSLDLTQTVQANGARNVKFDLPSSPNEVIARF